VFQDRGPEDGLRNAYRLRELQGLMAVEVAGRVMEKSCGFAA